MKTLFMLAILAVPACAQPQGTVNGIVIPNKAFDYAGPRTQAEVAFRLKNKRTIEKEDLPILERSVQAQRCSKLRGTIASMLQDQVMKEMALTVTPADLAEAKREFPPEDPQVTARMRHEHAAAVLAALDAQLNKHEDPQSVYDQYGKPLGIPPEAWAYQLLVGQTEDGKKSLMRDLNITVEALTQAIRNYDWSYQAKYKKMNQRIDDQISLSDPKFKQYLAEYNQTVVIDGPGRSHSTGVPADHLNYIQKQRAAYWADVHKKAQVVINDPTMRTCDLSDFGGLR